MNVTEKKKKRQRGAKEKDWDGWRVAKGHIHELSGDPPAVHSFLLDRQI